MSTAASPTHDSHALHQALTDLLIRETPSSQAQICQRLAKQGFPVNQSTVSRLLRKLQAIKTSNEQGQTVYRLPVDVTPSMNEPTGVTSLVRSILSNGNMIVIFTTTGSAQLVAKHIDGNRPPHVLATLAGDDTIFVAPSTARVLPSTLDALKALLLPE